MAFLATHPARTAYMECVESKQEPVEILTPFLAHIRLPLQTEPPSLGLSLSWDFLQF